MLAKDTVASPCVRNCCLNEQDICLGCFRSLDEICKWQAANQQTRLEVLALAEQRRVSYARFNNGLMSSTPTINK